MKFLFMEERNLLIQKYIFPVLVILTGLMLLNTAIFSGTGSTSQSGTFLIGSLVVVIMGVVTILYIKEIIKKNTHIILLGVMLLSCIILGYNTYSSVETTILFTQLEAFAASIVQHINGFSKSFLIFFFKIPLEPPLAGIKVIVFFAISK